MSIFLKPLNEITEADVQALKDNQVPESKTIDYKEELHVEQRDDKKEFLADVSSFANASGGLIIYGVAEDRGIPTAISGLQVTDIDATILRLDSMIQDSIEPRIPGLGIQSVTLSNGNAVIIVRIPKSWAQPHMVKASSRFFSRNSAGKYPLDVSQIRAAFLLSETVSERIRDFRRERLSMLIAGESPLQSNENAKYVLHIIPLNAFDSATIYDMSGITSLPGVYSMLSAWSVRGRHNFDGYLRYGEDSYLQIFRNGIIEAVDANIASPANASGALVIASTYFEHELIANLPQLTALQTQIGVEPPLIVMLSMLDVKNVGMSVTGRTALFRSGHAIDRDVLAIPDVLLETVSYDAATILRPIFDTVWNAAGWEQSPNYNGEGRWVEHQ